MDISVESSMEKAFPVKPILKAATQETIIVSNPEAPLVTSEMRQLLAQLTPAETHTPPLAPWEHSCYCRRDGIQKCSCGDNNNNYGYLEELTLQMIEQFFTTMTYCSKLVLFGWSPFKFTWSLLENQIENIRQTGGSDLVKIHQVLVEQLRMYSKKLKTLENVSPIDTTKQVLSDLHTAQECERKKIEEQIAEQTRHLDDFNSNYQTLTNDLQQSEFITKSTEGAV